MLELLLAGWLCLPLAPINPVRQDTLDIMAVQIFGGAHTGNETVHTGPTVGLKYEVLPVHPLVLRSGLEYRFGQVRGLNLPAGDLHELYASADVIYYRGTNRLTGYLGVGLLIGFASFSPLESVRDSLLDLDWGLDPNDPITQFDVDTETEWGYRLTLGLRFRETVSFEINITEIRPQFIYRVSTRDLNRTEIREEFRNNSFNVTFGYVISILE